MLMCLSFVYKLFLSGKTYHRFNRLYLLLSYAVAFGFMPVSRAVADAASTPQAPKVGDVVVLSTDAAYILPQWAVWTIDGVYVAGFAVMLAVTLANLLKMLKMRRGAAKREGNIVFLPDDGIAPFCWGGRIFVSEKDCAENGPAIIAHENTHLALHHWIDIMVAQLVIVFNWFNPAAWLMLRELKNVHEYQADAAVARSGVDVKEYQLMLIRKASGVKYSVLADCLNHGVMRKRIEMMLRKPSPRMSMLGSLLAVPALAAAFMLVNYDAMTISMWRNSGRTKIMDDDVSIIVDGKAMKYEDVNQMAPSRIKSITVIKHPKSQLIIELKQKEE